MLTRIVQPSPALETFLDSLHLNLSQPQREHLLQLVDGLLVCDERKTLAALQRQFLDATDPSNWADFLRISPWSAAERAMPSGATKSRGCWSGPKHGVCPKSSTSTSMTRSARRTSTPPTSSRSTGSTITTNPPHASPATTRPFAISNVPCAPGTSRPRSTCGSICATRPCGGSIAIGSPSTGSAFGASSTWPARSWRR